MATPSEKLADALAVLYALQKKGVIAVQSRDLSRAQRLILEKNGYLQEVIKGWYVPSRPDNLRGESTAWYASYWDFCASYLNKRFGKAWCLSPEQSLLLHAENWTVPKQLLIHSPKGNNKITPLLFHTSFLDVRYSMPKKTDMEEKQGLKIFSLIPALIACSPKFFIQHPTDIRAILSTIKDVSEMLSHLLEGGHSTVAGRLAGALRNIGNSKAAEDVLKTMQSAGYDVRETDPFIAPTPILLSAKELSPQVNRMRILWHQMRADVLANFPKASPRSFNIKKYLHSVDEKYVLDAYHSLSIEGYRVSEALIERTRSGKWNPDRDETDNNHKNALAARGYWQAFQAVKKSIEKVLYGENSGTVAWHDHGDWYRELFAPSVIAGILKPTDLAGYRNQPVFIRHSMHVPPSSQVVRDLMPAFFELLKEEPEASVRAVLGHFFFVYIHPYMDGNGRIGRFLMNVMLASGKYPWTIIPVEQREKYMTALEAASVRQDIIPFCDFIAGLVSESQQFSP